MRNSSHLILCALLAGTIATATQARQYRTPIPEQSDGAVLDLKPQYLELNAGIAEVEQKTDKLLSDDPAEGRPARLDQQINNGNLAAAAEQWARDEEEGLDESYHRQRSQEHDHLMKRNLQSAKEGIRLFFQVRAIEQARKGNHDPDAIWKEVASQLEEAGITNASSEIENSISTNRQLLGEWISRYPEIAVHIDIRSIDPELVIVKIRESIRLATTNLNMRELELRRAGLYAAMPEILRHRAKSEAGILKDAKSDGPPLI